MENHYQSEYDKIFKPSCSQTDIFSFVEDPIRQVFAGYNTTIFAYGQTGSGKTYTMFGKHRATVETTSSTSDTDDLGIIPRGIQKVFELLKKSVNSENEPSYTIHLSFIQIYNEKIYDCLQDPQKIKPLKIREDKYNGKDVILNS